MQAVRVPPPVQHAVRWNNRLTGTALFYTSSSMAATTTMKACAYPLDLKALENAAASSGRGCVLMRAGGCDHVMGPPSSNDPASSLPPCTGLVLEPGQSITEEDVAGCFRKGVRLILWQPAAAQTDAQKPSLWASSRAGMWNHLVFPAEHSASDEDLFRFALDNPNIVHSYSFSEQSLCLPPEAVAPVIGSQPGYGRVQPLPGVPVWRRLSTPEQLLHFLNAFGRQQVQKWMVMDNTSEVHCLGAAVRYHYACPDELPEGFFEEICRMVESGGSVDMQKVRYNLERAFLIGYAMEFGRIVGNSSLKQPRPAYIQSLNQNTGLDFRGYLERGYTSVRPEYRGMGIGTRLLEGLTKRSQGRKLYSIISEDNLATQKIAIRNKTRKVTAFYSRKNGKMVGVWVPE